MEFMNPKLFINHSIYPGFDEGQNFWELIILIFNRKLLVND